MKLNPRRALSNFFAVATLMVCLTVLGAKADPGTFHLVYLVSTAELKPGAKAFVEPIFFTDGHRIKSFYDYCRDYIADPRWQGYRAGRAASLRFILDPRQIADDVEPIHDYCHNKSFVLSVKGYSTLDNAGASVMLETVRFKANSMSFVTAVPPIMPDPGMATIAALSGQPARLPESANSPVGLQRFFLMTSSKELIEKIVPRVRYEDKDTKRLIERGRDLAKAKRGIQRARGFQELRRSGGFETVKTELFAPIFVDMDGDGQPDLAIGLRSIVPERSDETAGALKLLWAAVGLIYSSGREEFFGRPIGIGRYWALQKDGWVLDAPFALVRVDECLYLVTQPYPEYGPIKLYSLPNETDSCMDIGVFKVVDMSLWH